MCYKTQTSIRKCMNVCMNVCMNNLLNEISQSIGDLFSVKLIVKIHHNWRCCIMFYHLLR